MLKPCRQLHRSSYTVYTARSGEFVRVAISIPHAPDPAWRCCALERRWSTFQLHRPPHHSTRTVLCSSTGSELADVEDKLLTKQLAQAASLPELLSIASAHADRLNHFHAVVVFHRLAKHSDSS